MSDSLCCSSNITSTGNSVKGIRKVVEAFRNDAQNGACMFAGVGKDIKKSTGHLRAIGTEGTEHPSPRLGLDVLKYFPAQAVIEQK